MLYVCRLDWHIAPFRGERWLDAWEPAAEKCTAYGAKSWSLTRSELDPLAFQQTMVWESKGDFERYWFSQEIGEALPRFDQRLALFAVDGECDFGLHDRPAFLIARALK